MDSYTSMKTKLEQTGLYNISEGTNISNELNAYATALDYMLNELAVFERELYIDTAISYGIAERERCFGKERNGIALSIRRRILKAFEQKTCECTLSAFENTVKSYGVSNFEIIENYSGSEVTIKIRDVLSQAEMEMVKSRAEGDFPAHLKITIKYI